MKFKMFFIGDSPTNNLLQPQVGSPCSITLLPPLPPPTHYGDYATKPRVNKHLPFGL